MDHLTQHSLNIIKHLNLSCSCDFVVVTNSTGQTIARLSGVRSGFRVKVYNRGNTRQFLNITFTSNFAIRTTGFLARYTISSGELSFSHKIIPLTTKRAKV